MKISLKKKMAALAFMSIVSILPLSSNITQGSTKAITIAAIYSESNDAQAGAVVIDTAVGVALTLGWLCGIQAAVALIYAG